MTYLASLNPLNLLAALPGCAAQGLIWGIMALGVFVTFRLLDFADLTVDGSFATGGAVTIVLTLAGVPVWAALLVAVAAGLLAGFVTGLLHTKLGIPPILSGILVQIALYSINLHIMGMSANKAINVNNYTLLISARKYRAGDYCSGCCCCRTDRAVVLVLWYRDWFCDPCNGLQSVHE